MANLPCFLYAVNFTYRELPNPSTPQTVQSNSLYR